MGILNNLKNYYALYQEGDIKKVVEKHGYSVDKEPLFSFMDKKTMDDLISFSKTSFCIGMTYDEEKNENILQQIASLPIHRVMMSEKDSESPFFVPLYEYLGEIYTQEELCDKLEHLQTVPVTFFQKNSYRSQIVNDKTLTFGLNDFFWYYFYPGGHQAFEPAPENFLEEASRLIKKARSILSNHKSMMLNSTHEKAVKELSAAICACNRAEKALNDARPIEGQMSLEDWLTEQKEEEEERDTI